MMKIWLAALGIGFATATWAQSSTPEADAHFTKGQFEAAIAAYSKAPAGDARALRRQGQIKLFENKWEEAEVLLQKALTLDPADKAACAAMGELESRRDRFAQSAIWFDKAGRADTALALGQFGADAPYQHAISPKGSVEIPFIQTDPLPAVRALINGREGLFILDTGAGNVVLDPEFASAAGVSVVAQSGQGVFAGGKTGDIKAGKIGTLAFAGFEIANVPATLVPTAAFSAATGGKPVAGVLGTGAFSRFRTTIDYPRGRLIFEHKDAAPAKAPLARIPFYQVGTHYLLAEGRLNEAEPSLHFIDTGLAGFAFTAPESTLRAAGVALPALGADKGGIGQSAAGEFPIAKLRLGTFVQKNLKGLYGPFPQQLEQGLGVRVGGLVSHQFFRPYAVTFDFKGMKVELRQ